MSHEPDNVECRVFLVYFHRNVSYGGDRSSNQHGSHSYYNSNTDEDSYRSDNTNGWTRVLVAKLIPLPKLHLFTFFSVKDDEKRAWDN